MGPGCQADVTFYCVDTKLQVGIVRIMLSYPLFPSISLYLCKTSCPKHNIKLHNYATQLLRQHMACAYGQDTPILVMIRELRSINSKALHHQLLTIGGSDY